jgi:hypothetical protein
MFDLNKCKAGDKLCTDDGKLYTYVDRNGLGQYPHRVREDFTGCIYSYTDGGLFHSTLAFSDLNIVRFATKPKRVRIRKAKPVNKLLGLLEYVQEQGSNVDTWYAPDYIYGAFDKGGKHFYYGYEYKTLPYKAYIGLGNSKRHTVHTLNNFKGAVTKLLKGAK